MTWWSIIKISGDAKRSIMDRFANTKRRNKSRYLQGQSPKIKGDVDRKGIKCDMCGQRKSMRSINYYPPNKKALCNQCAKFKYGKDYKSMQTE